MSTNLRALRFDELHQVLLAARRSTFVGNNDVLDLVVSAGLDHDAKEIERAQDDPFARYRIAREVWTLTLRWITREAQRLAEIANMNVAIPTIRAYGPRDLATPAMLFLLADDASRQDVEGIARLYLELSVDAPDAVITEHFEFLLGKFFEANGIGDIFNRLPASLLPTPAHRFYAAMELVKTLDWWQYRLAITSFNQALNALVWRSNQLGGVDIAFEQVHVDSGMAMFLDVVGPERELPLPLLEPLFVDAVRDQLDAFAAEEQTILQKEARAALLRINASLKAEGDVSTERQQEILTDEALHFRTHLAQHPKLIERACFVYADAFSKFAAERLESSMQKVRDALDALPPDAYLLVEGSSDVIYYEGAIKRSTELRIRVIGCGGESKVLTRARTILDDNADACIVTVFDDDAKTRHDEAVKFFETRPRCRSFIYARGVVEDQISVALHQAALQTSEPFDATNSLWPQLSKWSWDQKQHQLEKVAHAKEVVTHYSDEGELRVPDTIASIVGTVIELASAANRKRMPPIESALHLRG